MRNTMGATALCSVSVVSSSRSRIVVELDDKRLAVVEPKGEAPARPIAGPFALDRGILFAENALAGEPDAINHPKAILILAATLLAIVSTLHRGAALPAHGAPAPASSSSPDAGADPTQAAAELNEGTQ